MLLFLIIPLLGILLRLGNHTNLTVINAGLLLAYLGLYGNSEVLINCGNWLEIGNLTIDWEIKIDMITRGILFPILLINFLVQLFSVGYMNGDPHENRYNLYLNFFVATMVLLVTADNLFVLFVGWEGVGLASYLLINFWFTRIYANLAGIKAFLTNRIGDWGLTLGLIFYWVIFGSFSLDIQNLSLNHDILNLLGIAVLLGAITKSAQIGLHSWLTRSMEGPTPVSALLHAATMVTAGVYLMLRMNLILEWSSSLLLIICWIGGLSALGGAIGGLLEQDIKKIIAYSTISQLGYMFIAIGFSEYNLSLWHLINHACFKALLFLSGGALIHSLFGIQDIRKFGSIRLPILSSAFLIGNLSIMAVPFMTGWWTKDQILLEVFLYNSFLWLIIYVAALITAAYSIKLFLSSFKSLPRLSGNNFNFIGDHLGSQMFIPLIVLMLCAIGLGYFTSSLDFYIASTASQINYSSSHTVFLISIFFLGLFALSMISRYTSYAVSLSTILPLNILDQMDLIYLKFITNFIAPCSTYLFRNFQGFLEIFMGGIGITRFIEGLAFRLELL